MSKKVGSLKDGILSLAGKVNERDPVLRGRFKTRYIRDWLNGSSENNSNHLVEIQAFDVHGTNVALGKPVYLNSTGVQLAAGATDGITTSNPYLGVGQSGKHESVIVDLGDYYDIETVKVWHFWSDGRIYNDTKTEVSSDGVNYYPIFDSAISGKYAETEAGRTYKVPKFGLNSFFPFDGTLLGKRHLSRNIIDTSVWTEKSEVSTIGNFTSNGSADENAILYHTNPWGAEELMWATPSNDAASAADGGWNNNNHQIDHTKKYRVSVWVRRENLGTGSGSTYLGCQGGTVSALGATASQGNPYFLSVVSTSVVTQKYNEEWALLVAYIHPSSYTGGVDPTTGVYSLDGTQIAIGENFKWLSTATVGGMRTYLYYSTKIDERHYWTRPRFEVCDGTEASIQDLLDGFDDAARPHSGNVPDACITDEGYYSEMAGTNLLSTEVAPTVYNNLQATISIKKLDETYKGAPVFRLSYKATTQAQLANIKNTLHGQGFVGAGQTFAANTDYVNSVYWRTVNKNDLELGGVSSNLGGWTSNGHTDEGNGWKRFQRYRTATTTGGTDGVHISIRCPSAKLNETIYVDFACHQLEAGRVSASGPMSRARTSVSLGIPLDVKPPYTINVTHRPNTTLSEVVDQATSVKILQLNNYYANASMTLWNYNKNITMHVKGDTGTEWATNKVFKALTPNEWNFKEHMYTLAVPDSKTVHLYMDGELLGTLTSPTTFDNIDSIILHPEKNSTARYKDLAIYNVALDATQINSIYKKNFSISKDGDLTIGNLREGGKIPKDATHIPLGSHTSDTMFMGASSLSEDGLVFENGSVFTGHVRKNYYTNPNFEGTDPSAGWSHWGSTGHVGTYGQTTDRRFIFSPDNTYSHWVANAANAANPYLLYQSPTYTAGYRSMQMIIRLEDGSDITNNKVYPSWNGGNGGVPTGRWTSIERIGDTPWFLCKAEGLSQDGSNNLIGIYVTAGNKVYVDHAQVELGHYCTPITLTEAPAKALQFNLYRDYGMDWSSDWTLSYWRKPLGTATHNTLNGYSVDSLGSNPNTLGSGYLWLGKDVGYNKHVRPTFDIVPDKYFNNWTFVCIRKENDKVTFYTYTPQGRFVDDTYIVFTTYADYFVTQHGYDLQLSGFNNTSLSNGMYRDLVFAKRAFTEVEIDQMYRSQISIDKDSVRINDIIKEQR